MKKICTVSGKEFEITEQDLKFYEKMEVPTPSLCPEESLRRRLAFRNERTLYHRNCTKTGKKIISMYSEDKPFPVYDRDFWWSDNWEPKDFGREFDFLRSFFEQFYELQTVVPRMALIESHNENCDFCNIVGYSQNCYLLFGSINCEDCFYGNPYFCKNCIDSISLQNSQFCYECLDSENLYECIFCQNCAHSNHLKFCFDVKNSHDCFACVGLRNTSFQILNKPYKETEYKKIIEEINLGNPKTVNDIWEKFRNLKIETPHKFMHENQNENVSGDVIFKSKNTKHSFQIEESEDVSCSAQIVKSKDIFSSNNGEFGELLYEFSGFFSVSNSKFSHWCWESCSELEYSSLCIKTKNCFGCIGLRNAEYCILNKQYGKEEYFTLRKKIIKHMKSHGEWGEFFPISISPFAYNETLAQEYYPMTKGDVLAKDWKWKDKDEKNYQPQIYQVPSAITEVPDTLCDEILACEDCQKNYKIQKPELVFYRKQNLPIPKSCPNCRHIKRMKLRNPRDLFERVCDNCEENILTSFAPDRPEIVYCEKCYLEFIN